jgi:RHS repeat-associated protein
VDGQDLSELCQAISLADLNQFAEWFGFSSTPEPFTNVYYYCYDANGNVTQLVDAQTGAIKAHYEYDPFGKILNQTGSAAEDNHFRFSTKYFDTETNLYCYGRRYYAPEIGRWINRDPIAEDGGINLYGFVLNDPVNLVDPTGEVGIIASFIVISIEFTLIKSCKFVNEQIEYFKLQKRTAKIIFSTLKLQSKIMDRLSDPCLPDEERSDFEKMLNDVSKNMDFLVKLQLDLSIKSGKSVYKYQY